mgnify:CR=1 FL=1
MTVVALTHEFAASKERFQKTLTISFVLHLVLFGWLMLRESISEAPEGIVEISWLAPLPETPPPAPVPELAEPKPVAEAKVLPPSKTEEKFQRQEKPAEVQPSPQELTANRDMVKERLAALAPAKMPSKALTAEPRTANSLLKSAPVEAPDPGLKASAVDLKRSDNPRPKPADLKRAPVETRRTKPAIAPATVEKQTTAAVPVALIGMALSAFLVIFRPLVSPSAGPVNKVAERPVLVARALVIAEARLAGSPEHTRISVMLFLK